MISKGKVSPKNASLKVDQDNIDPQGSKMESKKGGKKQKFSEENFQKNKRLYQSPF